MPIKMETVAAAPTTTSDLPEIKSEIKVEDFCNANTDGVNNVAQQQQQQQQPVVSTEQQMHQAQNNCNWVGHSTDSFSYEYIYLFYYGNTAEVCYSDTLGNDQTVSL